MKLLNSLSLSAGDRLQYYRCIYPKHLNYRFSWFCSVFLTACVPTFVGVKMNF